VGKLGKEGIDQIRALLGAGYSKTEVSKKMGIDRKTVSKYGNDPGPSLVQVDSGKVSLSLGDDITKLLYDMQGVMGASSIIGAVKQAYQNAVSLARLRVTHWPVYSDEEEFTAEAMIERLVGFIAYLEKEAKEDRKSIREAEAEIERLKELAEVKYDDGYEKGKLDFAIHVKCVHCNGAILIEPRGVGHRTIVNLALEGGVAHTHCINRARYTREAGSRALEAALRY
jgi:hypothetical protein